MVEMEKVVLNATRRKLIGKKVKQLRREGKLPGVMYGTSYDAIPVALDLRETTRSLQNLTQSTLVTIDLEGEPNVALVQEKQVDFIRGTILHIDFRIVSMKEKIRTSVPIKLEGLAPAVKDYNGIVVTNINELQVECLPGDLPEQYVLDLSNLNEIGDSILVQDVISSDKIQVFDDPDTVLVVITSQAAEEEEEEEEEELEGLEGEEGAEPEVIDKGKKEDEDEDE
jgi:large subunit ribosomal protein L25